MLGRACTATDLTNDISHDNPTFKGHQRTVMWQHLSHDDVQKFGLTKAPYSYEVVAFTLCGHTSTHCDSISHIVPEDGARPIDRTPLRVAHGARRLGRLRAQGAELVHHAGRRSRRSWPSTQLTLKPGSVFLYHTGWYRKFETAPFDYIRDYPGLDGEAAHWLADQRRDLRRRRCAERRFVPRGRGAHGAAGAHDVPRARRAEHREPARPRSHPEARRSRSSACR